MEYDNSNNYSAYSSYAGPNGIGSTERQMVGGAHKQCHTKNDSHDETANPKRVV